MANNTVRTIVIFGLITLVLGGAAVGAVRLMKARNDSYAAAQTQPVATNTPQQNTPADQKKDEAKKEEAQPPKSNENPQTTTPPPVTQTPAPQPASTPAPTDKGATPNGSMPATGPTDFFVTVGLLMLAVFFGTKLLKARADYRRYVGS